MGLCDSIQLSLYLSIMVMKIIARIKACYPIAIVLLLNNVDGGIAVGAIVTFPASRVNCTN